MAINVDISKITGINQVGNSYQRKSAVPLDYYSYFNTKAEAEAYAASNPVSYVGQIIAYSHEGKVVTCVIADAAGTLREIEKPIAGQLISVGADNSVNHAEIDEAPWVDIVQLYDQGGEYGNDTYSYTGNLPTVLQFIGISSTGNVKLPRNVGERINDHGDGTCGFWYPNPDPENSPYRKIEAYVTTEKSYDFITNLLFDGHGHVIGKFGGELPEQKVYSGDNKTISIEEDGTIRLFGTSEEAPPEGGQILSWNSDSETLQWIDPVEDTDTDTNTTYSFEFDKTEQKIKIGVSTTEKGEVVSSNTEELDLSDFLTADELPEAITYSVKDKEKVLKLEDTVFSTELGLKHENGKISLTGIGGEVIAEFSDAEFVADGVLEDVSYDNKTKNLTFTWNIVTGTGPDGDPIYKTDVVNIADLIDTYTAGNGIDLNNAEFSIKLHNETESFLSLEDETIDGLTKKRIKLSGVQDAIDAALEAAKDYADKLPHEDTLYTLSDGTPETEGDVKLILTPSEGDAQEVAVKAYNKAKIDKMLYEGSYKKGNETIPSNIAADDKANSRLISPAEMAKLAALVLSEDGTVGVSGTIEAANVKNLGEAIASKVTGATTSGGLGIESGAEKNIIETITVNNEALTPDANRAVNITLPTGVENDAEKNIIEIVKVNNQALEPDSDRAVNITVPTKLSDLTDDITHVKAVKMKEAVTDGYQPKLIVSQVGNNVTIDDSALQADTADVKRVADTAVQSAEFAGKTLTKNGTKVSITKEEAVEALGLKALAFTESIDTGVHAISLTSGTNSGTVKLIVDGTPTDNIAVTGLKSAAYTEATDYDIAGAAATAKSEVLGKSTDAAGAATVHGALNKAAEVLGTEADGATAKTVYGAHAAVVALQNGAVKSNADAIAKLAEDIGNVSNIMNFRGVVAHKEGNSLSQDVAEAGISDLKDGDVIIYGEKEYVYQGGAWHEFGDASGNASAIQALDERVDGIEERFGALETRKASNTQYGMVKGTANTTVDGVTTGTGVHIEEGMVKTVSMDLLINGDFEIIFCAGGAQ